MISSGDMTSGARLLAMALHQTLRQTQSMAILAQSYCKPLATNDIHYILGKP
jgi:hypothetical protein